MPTRARAGCYPLRPRPLAPAPSSPGDKEEGLSEMQGRIRSISSYKRIDGHLRGMTHVVFSKSVPHMYYIKIKGELVQHRSHPQYKKHITGSTPAKPNKLLRPNGESTRLNTKAMNTAQQTCYPTTMKDASKAISRKTSKGNSESPR
jgi:hypothetical protein